MGRIRAENHITMAQVTEKQENAPAEDAGTDEAAVIRLLPATWTVDIEAGGQPSEPAVDRTALRRLLDVLSDRRPSVGCTSWSYSVRFSIDATDDAAATMQRAVDVWTDAVAEAGLPAWPITRCEAHRRK